MTKRASIPAAAVDSVPLGQHMTEALNDLRNQLRAGGIVNVPALLLRALPDNVGAGDRVLIDDWRGHKVWGEWNGDGWVVEVFDNGTRRTQD